MSRTLPARVPTAQLVQPLSPPPRVQRWGRCGVGIVGWPVQLPWGIVKRSSLPRSRVRWRRCCREILELHHLVRWNAICICGNHGVILKRQTPVAYPAIPTHHYTTMIILQSCRCSLTMRLGTLNGDWCPDEATGFALLIFRIPSRCASSAGSQNDGLGSGGVGGNSRCCGRLSAISNQGAFEATCQWASGRMPGSSSRVPSGRLSIVGYSSEKAINGEPQLRQNVRCTLGDEL